MFHKSYKDLNVPFFGNSVDFHTLPSFLDNCILYDKPLPSPIRFIESILYCVPNSLKKNSSWKFFENLKFKSPIGRSSICFCLSKNFIFEFKELRILSLVITLSASFLIVTPCSVINVANCFLVPLYPLVGYELSTILL